MFKFRHFAFAAIALSAMASAHAQDVGGVPLPTVRTTTIVPTNVTAGINNTGTQSLNKGGNAGGKISVKLGPIGSVDTTVVVPTNVTAGINNTGVQSLGNVANGSRRTK